MGKNWSDKDEVHDAFMSKYGNSHIVDVKNWSDSGDVREDFMKKYAGSYMNYMESNLTNLNSMNVRRHGGDYQQYFKNYAPDVKNWSDREQVSDAFMKKFAGSYIDNVKRSSKSDDVDSPDMITQASSHVSDKAPEASSPSTPVSASSLAASTDSSDAPLAAEEAASPSAPVSTLSLAALKDSSDAPGAADTALASSPEARATPRLSLIIAVALATAGIAMLYSTRKAHSQSLRDSLLGNHRPGQLIEA